MPHDPKLLFTSLLDSGIDEFSGVPCSILNHLIVEAERSPDVRYLRASVEGEAVAAAAGTWLAGGLGAVLIQNSGLGNAVNPLASLAVPYEIPLLMIVSWRGEPGRPDEAHHYPMGAATRGLFDLFDIPVTVLVEDVDLEGAVADAVAGMQSTRRPVALVVPRGSFAKGPTTAVPVQDAGFAPADADARRAGAPGATSVERLGGGALPSRSEALDVFLETCGGEATVSTTGYMSRELFARGEQRNHFPMQGSMGFAPAIGLGIARVKPARPVYILDGDGALLMRMGGLATIGSTSPANLVHIVFDNGSYASTGGQPTVSPSVDFPSIALHCGYRRAASCTGSDGLPAAMRWASHAAGSGPALLHVRIDNRDTEQPRPEKTPPEIAASFREFLQEPSS